MNTEDILELFVLKCAALKREVDEFVPQTGSGADSKDIVKIEPLLSQFSTNIRNNAMEMAAHYKLFYMLENEIRRLIDDTLTEHSGGPDWWDIYAPESAKIEYRANLQREQEAGFTPRSENPLDYVTFGHLGDIIRSNYSLFGGILSNQKAMGRIMYSLNNLRGPIAHCGLLAEDEVDRLMLTVKDWFRLLEGPK
ncbi:Swt1 family HEPN domain-containing protein [Xanthobacter autotrophicus DSM 431]|uniref:Swt1 family HEPN domain-containing protein n=1 Tax=Xanthobacter nonsaccharivorans TaxID=3119912 RepID=UPI003727E724